MSLKGGKNTAGARSDLCPPTHVPTPAVSPSLVTVMCPDNTPPASVGCGRSVPSWPGGHTASCRPTRPPASATPPQARSGNRGNRNQAHRRALLPVAALLRQRHMNAPKLYQSCCQRGPLISNDKETHNASACAHGVALTGEGIVSANPVSLRRHRAYVATHCLVRTPPCISAHNFPDFSIRGSPYLARLPC